MGLRATEGIHIRKFALVVVGIVVGVSVGIHMRVNETLRGEVVEKEEKEDDSLIKLQKDFDQLQSIYDKFEKEKKVYLGLEQREIALRILDKYYPKGWVGAQRNDSHDKTSASLPLLKSSNTSITESCERLSEEEGLDDLKKAITMGNIGVLEEMSRYVSDDNLKRTVEIICELLTKED